MEILGLHDVGQGFYVAAESFDLEGIEQDLPVVGLMGLFTVLYVNVGMIGLESIPVSAEGPASDWNCSDLEQQSGSRAIRLDVGDANSRRSGRAGEGKSPHRITGENGAAGVFWL